MAVDGKNKRKLKNIIVDQKAQFRLFIPFLILYIVNLVVALLVQRQMLSVVADESLSSQNVDVVIKLSQSASSVLTILLVGVFCTGILSLCFWLFYSHRLFGPMVPIQRHIENLKNGQSGGQIRLRKYDEFQPLAESLNNLTQTLQDGMVRTNQSQASHK